MAALEGVPALRSRFDADCRAILVNIRQGVATFDGGAYMRARRAMCEAQLTGTHADAIRSHATETRRGRESAQCFRVGDVVTAVLTARFQVPTTHAQSNAADGCRVVRGETLDVRIVAPYRLEESDADHDLNATEIKVPRSAALHNIVETRMGGDGTITRQKCLRHADMKRFRMRPTVASVSVAPACGAFVDALIDCQPPAPDKRSAEAGVVGSYMLRLAAFRRSLDSYALPHLRMAFAQCDWVWDPVAASPTDAVSPWTRTPDNAASKSGYGRWRVEPEAQPAACPQILILPAKPALSKMHGSSRTLASRSPPRAYAVGRHLLTTHLRVASVALLCMDFMLEPDVVPTNRYDALLRAADAL